MAQNLGQIGALYTGSGAPTNTNMIWRDTDDEKHRFYSASAWHLFGSDVNQLITGVDLLSGSTVIPLGSTVTRKQYGISVFTGSDGAEYSDLYIQTRTTTSFTVYSAIDVDGLEFLIQP